MSNHTDDARVARRVRHERIRAEVASEEAEALEAEAAEAADTLDVPLHLRITRGMDAELRARATAERIPTSALVRRLLTQAAHDYPAGGLTEADVEKIARRVLADHTGQ